MIFSFLSPPATFPDRIEMLFPTLFFPYIYCEHG